MKKNELLHFHAFLVKVAEDYVERGDAPPDAFDPYRELGVTPMTVRASREQHEEAVRTLAQLLADVSAQTDARYSDSGASVTASQ